MKDAEKIIKALKSFPSNATVLYDSANNETVTFQDVVDYVCHLQSENERLTSLYDGKHGIMTSSIGDLPLTVEGLRKAVDEISRLLIVQAELQELNAEYYNDAKDLRRENKELQKQVDELKNKCCEISFERYEEGKYDTAKEIFEEIDSVKEIFPNDISGYEKHKVGVCV